MELLNISTIVFICNILSHVNSYKITKNIEELKKQPVNYF